MTIREFSSILITPIIKNILLMSLIAGALLLSFGYTDILFEEESKWKEVLKVMGTVILSSGVFMSISKSYQFTNIFKDELRKVIYAKENLETRKDLDSLWHNVTDALCRQKFAPISKNLLKIIKDYYLPMNHEFYYSNYDLDVDIELDQKNDGYVLLNEETKVTVVVDGKKGTIYKFSSIIPYPEDDDNRTSYSLEEITVNGKKIDIARNLEDKCTRENGFLTVSYSFTCDSARKEYHIVRKEKKRYALSCNTNRSHKAICLYNNFSLDLTFPKNMNFEWVDLGVLGKWDKTRKDTQGYNRIKAKYTGVMFRNQGFLLIYS